MKRLLLLFLFFPALVCANEPVKSNKIQLEFIQGVTGRFATDNRLYSWLSNGNYYNYDSNLEVGVIRLKVELDTITELMITDENIHIKSFYCDEKNQQWKTKTVFLMLLSKPQSLASFVTDIRIPCIRTSMKSSGYIELKVLVKSKGIDYYNTFKLSDPPR